MKLQRYIFKDVDGDESEYYECGEVDPKIRKLKEQLARAEERLKRVQYKSHKNAYKVHGHFCQAVIDNKAIHDSVEQYFKDKGE